METIISLIAAVSSPLAAIVGIVASGKLTAYRLEQLENKVSAHNNLIERMYRAEENIEIIRERQNMLERRE